MEESSKGDQDNARYPQVDVVHTRQERVIRSYVKEDLEGKQGNKHPICPFY